MTSEIKVDTISEQTSANGVTIDGLTIKDGNIIGDVALAGTTPTFTIGDAGAEDAALIFDGNAQDFYIALDDSADDLLIGKGSTVGTTPAISIDENLQVKIVATTATTSTTTGSLIAAGGVGIAADLIVGDDIKLQSDGGVIHFGVDDDIFLRHEHNSGLTLGGTGNLTIAGALSAAAASTITTADNSDTLTLISTDADASIGPNLDFYRNSSSPADNDLIGLMSFRGRNDNSQDVDYAKILTQIADASDGTEDGILDIRTILAGTEVQRAVFSSTETVFNEESKDLDFRVESNNDTNAFFVQGSDGFIGAGTNTPETSLHLLRTDLPPIIQLENSKTATDGGDFLGQIMFHGRDGTTNASGDRAFIKAEIGNTSGGCALQFGTANSAAAVAERMRILPSGNICIGQTDDQGGTRLLVAYGENNDAAGHYRCTHASYVNIVLKASTNKSGNSNFELFRASSNNEADPEFVVKGDGTVFADGAYDGSGADYAEYFEWKDGNSSDENRRGYSVVLDGNKIVKATDSDDASKIIGVISGNPAVVGDSAWNKWNQKHLKDDFGTYIWEDYTVTEWTETVEDGDEIQHVQHSYPTDEIPDGVTAPSDATVLTTEKDKYGNDVNIKRRKINPDWNKDTVYISREDRKEWDTVGLVGKLRLKKGQPTGTNWIKMRDISSDVEEWLVR